MRKHGGAEQKTGQNGGVKQLPAALRALGGQKQRTCHFAVSLSGGAQGRKEASIALAFAKIPAKAPGTPKESLILRARILFHIRITSRKSRPPAAKNPAFGCSRLSPLTCFQKKNFRDREHLHGGPVSKTIEGAGHSVRNRCPSPAHSRAVFISNGDF
jgi:hypothetical protein